LRGSGRFRQIVGALAPGVPLFQSPSLRGSGRFRQIVGALAPGVPLFQSPSLRGSGRFHRRRLRRAGRRRVSIPFIAGQWSLHEPHYDGAPGDHRVSIPFIAGQWSLLPAVLTVRRAWGLPFQSPSLRGSGRFRRARLRARLRTAAFQSPSLRGSGRFLSRASGTFWRMTRVSIPFIAGQWSLPELAAILEQHPDVSIPFIAGQWSLPPFTGLGSPDIRGVSIPFIAGQWSLPERLPPPKGGASRVSIPFIAGQWSLPGGVPAPRRRAVGFQSPSLRGSGRFATPPPRAPAVRRFNPLHCGAVVASKAAWQVLYNLNSEFQSPSLRGSGRF